MKLTAVKVLPLPVAIWISARGRSAASDASRLRDGLDLAVAQAAGVQRRHAAQARAQRVVRGRGQACRGLASQSASVSGRWKAKTRRLRGVGVEAVGEPRLDAGGLVEERQRPARGAAGRRAGRRGTCALCASTPVRVSPPSWPRRRRRPGRRRRAGSRRRRWLERELADGDAAAGAEVEARAVLHAPAALAEQVVYGDTRPLFGFHLPPPPSSPGIRARATGGDALPSFSPMRQ